MPDTETPSKADTDYLKSIDKSLKEIKLACQIWICLTVIAVGLAIIYFLARL
jgi:hypothetical protein